MGRLKGSKDGVYTFIKLTCHHCNQPFQVYPAQARKGSKFCSRICKDKSLIGKKHTAEHNRKIALGGIGRKNTPEAIANMRIAQRNRPPITDETRKKMSTSAQYPKKDGKCVTEEGYILIWSPKHPYKNSNNYVLEHRLAMEKHLNRYLLPSEVVHHINNIVDDNRIENLMLFPNSVSHRNFHRLSISPPK